jgi:excisionase family DNA binding protein
MDLTVKQAAAKLGVHPATITRWIAAGLFPNAYKLNRASAANSPYRIPAADVAAFQRANFERCHTY